MITYFAHPVSDYGTDHERACIAALVGQISACQPVNPNTPEHAAGYLAEGMVYFKRVCMACDACVFLRFPGGQIGAGVGAEVRWFLSAGKPVWEIDRQTLRIARTVDIYAVLSIDETRALIASLSAGEAA